MERIGTVNHLGEYAPDAATGFLGGWVEATAPHVSLDTKDTATWEPTPGPQGQAITFSNGFPPSATWFPVPLVRDWTYTWRGMFEWIGAEPADSSLRVDMLFRVSHFDHDEIPTSSWDDTLVELEVNEDHGQTHQWARPFTAKGANNGTSPPDFRFDGLLIQRLNITTPAAVQLQFSTMEVLRTVEVAAACAAEETEFMATTDFGKTAVIDEIPVGVIFDQPTRRAVETSSRELSVLALECLLEPLGVQHGSDVTLPDHPGRTFKVRNIRTRDGGTVRLRLEETT